MLLLPKCEGISWNTNGFLNVIWKHGCMLILQWSSFFIPHRLQRQNISSCAFVLGPEHMVSEELRNQQKSTQYSRWFSLCKNESRFTFRGFHQWDQLRSLCTSILKEERGQPPCLRETHPSPMNGILHIFLFFKLEIPTTSAKKLLELFHAHQHSVLIPYYCWWKKSGSPPGMYKTL